MTITAYQVDSVIKAYQKQNRVRPKAVSADAEDRQGQARGDVVSISGKQQLRTEAYKKISYNLKDILINGSR